MEKLRSRRGVRQSVNCGRTGVYIYYCDHQQISTKICNVLTGDLPKTLFVLEVCSF